MTFIEISTQETEFDISGFLTVMIIQIEHVFVDRF